MTAQNVELDEAATSMAVRRIKQNPFLILGIAGFFGTLAVGAYKFKNRPKGTSISLFLVQLRVAAQSAVIGSLTVGMVYGMLQRHVFNKEPESQPK